MVFLDSYYSINFNHNGQKKELVFDGQIDILRLRREAAVNALDDLLKKIKIENITYYIVELVFWEQYIQHDIDNGSVSEFEVTQKNVLVSIDNLGVKLNFHNLRLEAQNMIRYGADFTGKMVKIKNDKGEEIDVLNDKLLMLLNIDFDYFEGD